MPADGSQFESSTSVKEQISNHLKSKKSPFVFPKPSENLLEDIKMHQRIKEVAKGHVDSMNDLYNHLKDLASLCRQASLRVGDQLVELYIDDIHIENPCNSVNTLKKIYPAECRIGSLDYVGKLTCDIVLKFYEVDKNQRRVLNAQYKSRNVDCGLIPVMVGSNRCNLFNLNPVDLAKLGEEYYEFGGYFILNGNERVCRMSIAQKRNFPLAIRRVIKSHDKVSANKVCIRSVKSNYQIISWVLLDPIKGKLLLRIALKGDFHFDIFLILKALLNATEKQICDLIVGKREENPTLFEMVQFLLRSRSKEDRLISHEEARIEIGSRFAIEQSEDPMESCKRLFNNYLLIHLDNDVEKFNALIFACRRLLLLELGKIEPDDPDAFHLHEITTPSIVCGTLIQNVLSGALKQTSAYVRKLSTSSKKKKDDTEVGAIHATQLWNRALSRCMAGVGRAISSTFSTGNFPSSSIEKVWLNAFNGIFITATRLNMLQFISHFRVAHRGQQFQETKLLEPRRLKTAAWGYICPVNTPDGTLCGLVNHMTSSAKVSLSCDPKLVKNIQNVLWRLGMIETSSPPYIPIVIDGNPVGGVHHDDADNFVNQLRMLKVIGEDIPYNLEIGYHRYSRFDREQFPYIFIATHEARLVRPVIYLPLGKIEEISPFEQAHLHICIDKNTFIKGKTTHQEENKTNILSILGNLTPFSEHNQSPRNIYECGMAKQSMANPMYSLDYRSDTKTFKLENPQKPISRTFMQSQIPVDDYAIGTNAIVAVISHTGHDMEDGMIVCRDSMQRGFAYGSVYMTDKLDAPADGSFFSSIDAFQNNLKNAESLDCHGLPRPGQIARPTSALYSQYMIDSGSVHYSSLKGDKSVIVDRVTTVSSSAVKGMYGNAQNIKANIITRAPVPPNIGDKFASRHGQKGICSLLYPQVDMPFSASGMVPDIIINPNAFPSRMTIGMLIESMAGKAGAIYGEMADASTFGTNLGFDEKNTPFDYFGKKLAKAGYNYFGSEILYDGTTGEEMKAEIFIGIVYYQRLKHMVIDKYQSRADYGPIDYRTKQPIKGRKRGGGIRFGEMERDALLSHGAASVLRDRLLHCSDDSQAWICTKCGKYFDVQIFRNASSRGINTYCSTCASDRHVTLVSIPAVYNFLVRELAGLGIELRWNTVKQ